MSLAGPVPCLLGSPLRQSSVLFFFIFSFSTWQKYVSSSDVPCTVYRTEETREGLDCSSGFHSVGVTPIRHHHLQVFVSSVLQVNTDSGVGP